MTRPIARQDRAQILDALRGFALLGILISHVPDFSGLSFITQDQRESIDALGIDGTLADVQEFLIRGKFYSLFALLFGIGFAVQLQSATRRGAQFSRHFARRLSILLIIGIAHASIWYGDILKDYALIGFLLIITARWSLNAVIWAAVATLGLRLVWPFLMAVIAGMAGATTSETGVGDAFSTIALTFEGTQIAAIFQANLHLVGIKAMQMLYEGKALSVLFMFLLGTIVGRTEIFRDLEKNRQLFWRLLLACAPVGIAGNVLLVPMNEAGIAFPPNESWVAERVLFAVAVPALAIAYASTFALIWSYAQPHVLKVFSHTGRMALTTYVSQTLILAALFYGVGFGLHGTIGLAEGTLLAVAVFAAQSALAAMWFRVFQFGPLEWIWRRFTYGEPVRILRQTSRA